jgi:hypothetical protein
MKRQLLLPLLGVVVVSAQVHAAEQDHSPWQKRLVISLPAEHGRDEWLLGFIDDGLAFNLHGREVLRDDNATLPPFPVEDGQVRAAYRFSYSRDGDTLQIDIGDQRAQRTKTFAEHNHWYMTAAYDDKGGDVSLAKEEGKHSKWKFVPSGKHSGEVTYYYIQNINDLGKIAWLTMGSPKKHYKGGFVTRKARLSFEEKQEFGIEDAESGK